MLLVQIPTHCISPGVVPIAGNLVLIRVAGFPESSFTLGSRFAVFHACIVEPAAFLEDVVDKPQRALECSAAEFEKPCSQAWALSCLRDKFSFFLKNPVGFVSDFFFRVPIFFLTHL
jgi:hypothetical protein